ncbi:MAG: hypothetical protein AB7F40_06785 [Victivallaceae bacterium]|nr:hypothetical protein [Victivallaceae bacterium]
MRRLLIVSQMALAVLLAFLVWLLLFHSFAGEAAGGPVSVSRGALTGTAPTLEQMRAWGDFIVQKNLFSSQRGGAAPLASEGWSKEDPPFELVAVDGSRAGFVPAGADRNTTPVRWLSAGDELAEKITVLEVRTDSVLVRKPDGLREMKMNRAAAGAVRVVKID